MSGEQIGATLSQQFTEIFGSKKFEGSTIYVPSSAKLFPFFGILQTLCAKLRIGHSEHHDSPKIMLEKNLDEILTTSQLHLENRRDEEE